MRALSSLVVGVIFGLGLVLSGMVNPRRIVGFLDVFGAWDPTLLFVMTGALAVSFAGYRLVFRRGKPLLEEKFNLPTATAIDGRLIGGAALFGIGWGMSGFCPGPGIAALSLGDVQPVLFVAAMLAGMAASRLIPAG
jgi:uncharacterized membrane protein YedE/YeeE